MCNPENSVFVPEALSRANELSLAAEKRKLYLSEWPSGQGTDTCKWECVIIFPPLMVRDSFVVQEYACCQVIFHFKK
jgi:hypothetical protein